MCVILVCDTTRPTPEMVMKAWKQNDHGGGVAWRENGYVHWQKNLTETEMQKACKTLPFPFVAHFRIASQGGRASLLCHPFEVNKQATSAYEGKTKGAVLFHNGTWTGWRNSILDACVRSNTKVPTGEWNDTRAMALMASIYGDGILEFINEKVVVFGPKQYQYFGDGWEEVDDIVVSNKLFLTRFHSGQGYHNHGQGSTGRGGTVPGVHGEVRDVDKPLVQVINSYERTRGGAAQEISFRGSFQFVSGKEDQPETVQADQEELHEAIGAGSEGPKGVKQLTEAEEDLLRAWNAAQEKNPKVYHTGTPVVEDPHLIRRIDAAAQGIHIFGRL